MIVSDVYKSHLARCTRFRIANATLSKQVLVELLPALASALKRGARGEIIIGLDLFQADPEALRSLMRLARAFPKRLSCGVFQLRPQGIFHPKLAVFDQPGRGIAIVGSSNLSIFAWHNNVEVDVVVEDRTTLRRLAAAFNGWTDDDRCVPLDAASLATAEALWVKHAADRHRLLRGLRSPTSARSHSPTAQPAPSGRQLPDRIRGHRFAITGEFRTSTGTYLARKNLVHRVANLGGTLLEHTNSARSAKCLIIGRGGVYRSVYGGRKKALASESGTPQMTPDEFWALIVREEALQARTASKSSNQATRRNNRTA